MRRKGGRGRCAGEERRGVQARPAKRRVDAAQPPGASGAGARARKRAVNPGAFTWHHHSGAGKLARSRPAVRNPTRLWVPIGRQAPDSLYHGRVFWRVRSKFWYRGREFWYRPPAPCFCRFRAFSAWPHGCVGIRAPDAPRRARWPSLGPRLWRGAFRGCDGAA